MENKRSSQESYDVFVAQGTKIAAAVSDNIRKNPNQPGVVGTIADAMVDIINKVEEEAAKHGITFENDVKFHGAQNILSNLLRMSHVTLDDDQVKQVVGHMVGRYLDEAIKKGKMSKEQVVQLGQQVEQEKMNGNQAPQAVEVMQNG